MDKITRKKAKELNRNTYNGSVCKININHLDARYTSNGTCVVCSKLKSKTKKEYYSNYYYKNIKHKKEVSHKYYLNNSEKIKIDVKNWQNDNKDKYIIMRKEYCFNNNEKLKIKSKIWRIKNRDIIRKKRKLWYLKIKSNKDYQEKRREYRKTQGCKISKRISNHIRNTNKRNTSDGTINKINLSDLLLKQSNKCNICGANLNLLENRKVHLDHIVPLSKGGIHTIDNVQWLCQYCNLIKGNNYCQ